MDNIQGKRNSGEQSIQPALASESIQTNPAAVQQVLNKEEIKQFLKQVRSLCDAMNNITIIESMNPNQRTAMEIKQRKEKEHEDNVDKTLSAAMSTKSIIEEVNLQNPDDIDKFKKGLSGVIESYAEMVSHGIANLRGTLLVNVSILDAYNNAQKIAKNYQLNDSIEALDDIDINELKKTIAIQKKAEQNLGIIHDDLQKLSNRIRQHIGEGQELFYGDDHEIMKDNFVNQLENKMIGWMKLSDPKKEGIEMIIQKATDCGLYKLVEALLTKKFPSVVLGLTEAIERFNYSSNAENKNNLQTKIRALKMNRGAYGSLLDAVQNRAAWDEDRYIVHTTKKSRGIVKANEFISL